MRPPPPAPPDDELRRDHELLTDAVRAAGALALTYFRADPQSWEKRAGDPVSEADIAVDDLLRARLARPRPGYGWLSEESEDDRARLAADRVWIVDPIDGTSAFLEAAPNSPSRRRSPGAASRSRRPCITRRPGSSGTRSRVMAAASTARASASPITRAAPARAC